MPPVIPPIIVPFTNRVPFLLTVGETLVDEANDVTIILKDESY